LVSQSRSLSDKNAECALGVVEGSHTGCGPTHQNRGARQGLWCAMQPWNDDGVGWFNGPGAWRSRPESLACYYDRVFDES